MLCLRFPLFDPMLIFSLAEAIVACLDRESVRKLVRLDPADLDGKRFDELALKKQHGTLTTDEQTELDIDTAALFFLEDLKKKGRAVLRRPRGSERST